ncbi:MAG: HD-GYP domain-containing protein [Spirochaetales bacterium]|nr:HD-GYP domain-containing protein [Spirochaetales bacterium]
MKTYLLSELKQGMMFTEPVYIDEDTILVPAEVKITEKDLERLKRWKIESVMSDGVIKSEIPVLSPGDVKNPLSQLAFHNEDQRQLMDKYTKWSAKLEQVFHLVKEQKVVDREGVLQIIAEISQTLHEQRDAMIQFILYGVQGGFGIIGNAINGTVIAMLMGIEMNFLAHKLQQLAIAALLRDVGMVKIPEGIREKNEALEKQELQLIKTHPLHTYKILTKDMGFSEEVATTSMQHHERWDGKGYPRSIKGKEISLPARIVSIADAFEAMVSERPYRDSMIGYAAVRTILGDNGRRFDPEVVKIFIRTFGIYPIGSIVLLSDASIGRVIENHTDVPLRPRVKIMIGSDGHQFSKDEGQDIDLKDQKSVFIARAINPKDLPS